MSYVLRRATAEDVPTIAEIAYEAYRIYGRPNLREHAEKTAADHWPHCFLVEQDGRTIAQAAVARHPIQVGRSQILKAEIGGVGVRPECQGRGVGTYLMSELMALLPREGFHCTRLGGLMKYYRRFGYEPFPRRYVQIPLQPLDADCRGITWRELLSAPPEAAACVRPYDPQRDHESRWELMQRFNLERSGRMVDSLTDPPAPGAEPDPMCLVFEQDGMVRGFLHGFIGPVHAGQPPVYQVSDLAVDFDYPQAVEALLKAFLTQAASTAPTTVSCRLPYDERLFEQLTAAGIQFDILEMRGAFDGNMMQVLDLPGLLEAIAPELTARLQRAGVCPWQGTLKLVLPRHQAVLRVSAEAVSVELDGPVHATLELSHAILLKWVLGINGAGEHPWLTGSLNGPQQVTLNLLFPRLPAASGTWG